jgi:hypothetical protein
LLRDGARGLIVKCWAGCAPAAILDELRRRGLLSGRCEYRPGPPAATDRDNVARHIDWARRIWDRA